MRSASAAIAVLFVGVAAAACSSHGENSAAPASTPAVCSSIDALQTSVTDLENVHVSAAGLATLQKDLVGVGAEVRQVVADGKDQYATNVDHLQGDYDTVQSAATAAKADPTAGTLGALSSSVSALANGVKAFANDVATTC
jgi:hypothetical protein